MDRRQPVVSRHISNTVSKASYVTGFLLSLVLTFTAFSLVIYDMATGALLASTLLALAFLQVLVQLQFFIHLGHESGLKLNRLAFMFMGLVVFIVVGGSLWIMSNLDYQHGMKDNQTVDEYIFEKERISR